MKVLHIGLSETLGGIERFLINVYNNKPDIIDMDFIATGEQLHYDFSSMITNNKSYHVFHVAKTSSPLYHFLDIYHIIKQNHYDIIHIHKNSLANPLAIIAARMAGKSAIIIHSHNTQPSGHRIVGSLFHKFNKFWLPYLATKWLACSALAGNWLFPSHDYQVVHNAINLDDFYYRPDVRERKRRALGLENCFVIGSVARISDQKNQLFMVDIMKAITEHHQNVRMLLIGGKNETAEGQRYLEQLKKKIDALQLGSYIKLLGSRDDVKDYYQVFDVYLQPSKYEGLCIAAIEAQAAGLPCVVSDVLSKETKIIKEYTTVSLSQPAERWSKIILALHGMPRFNKKSELEKAGYSMQEEISLLKSVYQSLIRN